MEGRTNLDVDLKSCWRHDVVLREVVGVVQDVVPSTITCHEGGELVILDLSR